MHLALQLSELLRSIFEHCEDDEQSLLSAMLVNRAWCNEAAAVLWLSPPALALAALPADRHTHYAGRLRSLTVPPTTTAEAGAALAELHYPCLRRLQLEYMPALPVPFAGRCPSLRAQHTAQWLTGDDGDDDDCGGHIRALLHEHVAQLQAVETSMQIPPALLVRMAQNRRLVSLVMRTQLLPAQVLAVAERVAAPFATLREFVGRTTCALAPMLLTLVGAVASLSLDYIDSENLEQLPGGGDGGGDGGLAAGGASPLTDLTLALFSDAVISKTPLLQLKSLSGLRSLWLGAYRHVGYLTETDLDDGDFVDLVSGLPLLRVLSVYLAASLTLAALKGLGAQCRYLRDVRIDHAFALDALENTGLALFPELWFLEVRGAALEVDSKRLAEVADNVFRVFTYHAPKLRDFHLTQQHSLDTAVSELRRNGLIDK